MAYTQVEIETKIAALEDAFARQTLTVEFADRRVTYRSFNEIEQAINYWQRKLDLIASNGRSKQSYGVAAKGFGAWAGIAVTEASVRCRFGEGTFASTHGNGQDAP